MMSYPTGCGYADEAAGSQKPNSFCTAIEHNWFPAIVVSHIYVILRRTFSRDCQYQ
jgi:hypothetical protein